MKYCHTFRNVKTADSWCVCVSLTTETQLSDNDDDRTQDLTMVTDTKAEVRSCTEFQRNWNLQSDFLNRQNLEGSFHVKDPVTVTDQMD